MRILRSIVRTITQILRVIPIFVIVHIDTCAAGELKIIGESNGSTHLSHEPVAYIFIAVIRHYQAIGVRIRVGRPRPIDGMPVPNEIICQILQTNTPRHLDKTLHNSIFTHTRCIACYLVHVGTFNPKANPIVIEFGIHTIVLTIEFMIRGYAIVTRICERETCTHIFTTRRSNDRVVHLASGIIKLFEEILLGKHWIRAILCVITINIAPTLYGLSLHLRSPTA